MSRGFKLTSFRYDRVMFMRLPRGRTVYSCVPGSGVNTWRRGRAWDSSVHYFAHYFTEAYRDVINVELAASLTRGFNTFQSFHPVDKARQSGVYLLTY
jgi:hypothetical protein